jgi:hypothetical protein
MSAGNGESVSNVLTVRAFDGGKWCVNIDGNDLMEVYSHVQFLSPH